MARDRQQRAAMSSSRPDTRQAVSGPLILAIGDVSHWRQSGRSLPADGEIYFAEFHEVNAAFLETIKPDVILSPLLSSRFDCIDLAQKLAQAGYKGRYRAMAPSIPNPAMVRLEIIALYPGLDFDIVSFSSRQQPKLI